METGELLKNLRLIVREEMTQFSERMDARFDLVYTLFDGVYVRLHHLEAEVQSINGILARIAPYDPQADSSLRTYDENACRSRICDHA
ncbi:MAG TPA: hypothetical protein VN380_03200 [Thermoanaerobaculia bacterium]|jgi:hypothetical protein|nr:hypothetical protein [Thermoanaerobaculia bacterium]